MTEDHVVAVSTHNEGIAEFFDDSCRKHWGEPVVLGMGREWKSFLTKLDIMREWADTISDECVVLYLDRFDIVVVRDLAPLFQFYRDQLAMRNNQPFIYISTENFSEAEIGGLLARFQYGLYARRILNTGSFMMTGRMLKDMLQELSNPSQFPDIPLDDQAMITAYLLKHKEIQVEMDDNRRFLVYGAYRFDMGRKLHIDPVTHVTTYKGFLPYVIHRNASGCFKKILTDLGYDISKTEFNSNHVARIFTHHIPNFCQKLVRKATQSISA